MKWRVPTGDFRLSWQERLAVKRVLNSGSVSEGAFTAEFERKWAAYLGTKHCVAVNSGTSALMAGFASMDALDYPGDTFITTPFTYMATINAPMWRGLQPRFVDIEPERLGMDPERLAEELEGWDETKWRPHCVVPVHIMGVPCCIKRIRRVCRKHNVPLVEDNCQGYGSKHYGEMLGSFGLWSACSFFVAHTLQVGEMGCVNTSDSEFVRMVRKVKSNGRLGDDEQYAPLDDDALDLHRRYTHNVLGGNFRTQEFSAALACAQIGEIDQVIRKRNENVKFLNEQLEFTNDFRCPMYHEDYAYLGYPVVLGPSLERRKVRMRLEAAGIETRPMYGCLPLDMPALKDLRKDYVGKLPVAEDVGRNAFYVGCHQFLSQDDMQFLAKALKEALR